MGTISVNKLGGLSLIIGPLVGVIAYLIRPGGGLIGGTVDPANAQASIKSLLSNSDLAAISFLLIPLGLILMIYGVNAFVKSLKGGNGEAVAQYGALFFLLAAIGWITASALTLTIAGGNTGAAAGAVYATGLGINITSSVLGAVAFLAIGLAVSTRDDFNKGFAMVVAVVGAVLLVISIWSALDTSMLQTAGLVSGIGFVIITIWTITLGLGLMKKS